MLEWHQTGSTRHAEQNNITYTVTPIPVVGTDTQRYYLLLSGRVGSWGHVFASLDDALSEAEQTAHVYARIVAFQPTNQEDRHA